MIVMILVSSIFVFLFTAMPNEFFPEGERPDIAVQSREVVATLNAYDMVVYQNTWNFNISRYDTYSNQSGLNAGNTIEFTWGYFSGEFALLVQHAYPSPLGDWWIWSNDMHLTQEYADIVGYNAIHLNWGVLRLLTQGNAIVFAVTDGDVNANFIVMPYNETWSIQESWDNGLLTVQSSYELDFDAMKPNAWYLIVQLLFFQSPDFGLGDNMLGDLINYSFGLLFWIITALIIYTIVTRLVPTIQGGLEN